MLVSFSKEFGEVSTDVAPGRMSAVETIKQTCRCEQSCVRHNFEFTVDQQMFSDII